MQRGSAMGNHKKLALFQGINAAATDNCTQALDRRPASGLHSDRGGSQRSGDDS